MKNLTLFGRIRKRDSVKNIIEKIKRVFKKPPGKVCPCGSGELYKNCCAYKLAHPEAFKAALFAEIIRRIIKY